MLAQEPWVHPCHSNPKTWTPLSWAQTCSQYSKERQKGRHIQTFNRCSFKYPHGSREGVINVVTKLRHSLAKMEPDRYRVHPPPRVIYLTLHLRAHPSTCTHSHGWNMQPVSKRQVPPDFWWGLLKIPFKVAICPMLILISPSHHK